LPDESATSARLQAAIYRVGLVEAEQAEAHRQFRHEENERKQTTPLWAKHASQDDRGYERKHQSGDARPEGRENVPGEIHDVTGSAATRQRSAVSS
jgi:hypothetical protein